MWIFRGEKRERKENPREISIYSRWFRVVSIPKLGGTSNLTPCLPHSHRETGGTTRTERRRATPPETFWNCSHLFDHLGFLSPSSPCSEIRATRGTRNCGTHSDSPRRGARRHLAHNDWADIRPSMPAVSHSSRQSPSVWRGVGEKPRGRGETMAPQAACIYNLSYRGAGIIVAGVCRHRPPNCPTPRKPFSSAYSSSGRRGHAARSSYSSHFLV